MKKIILIITILSFFLSCVKEDNKSDFIGNWSSTSDTNIDINITFSNDLLLIENPVVLYDSIYSSKWKVIGKKIEHEGSTWDYILNSSKDTLWIKHETDSTYEVPFRKIKNNVEFLENRIGIELKLPKTEKNITSYGDKESAFTVYLAKQNDSIVIRGDNYFRNFKRLQYHVIEFFYSKDEKERDNLKFAIFTDSSISEREIDSIKNKLRELPIKKIFRVYDSESYVNEDWKSEVKWLGKYE